MIPCPSLQWTTSAALHSAPPHTTFPCSAPSAVISSVTLRFMRLGLSHRRSPADCPTLKPLPLIRSSQPHLLSKFSSNPLFLRQHLYGPDRWAGYIYFVSVWQTEPQKNTCTPVGRQREAKSYEAAQQIPKLKSGIILNGVTSSQSGSSGQGSCVVHDSCQNSHSGCATIALIYADWIDKNRNCKQEKCRVERQTVINKTFFQPSWDLTLQALLSHTLISYIRILVLF